MQIPAIVTSLFAGFLTVQLALVAGAAKKWMQLIDQGF